jgi:hypothetical protein
MKFNNSDTINIVNAIQGLMSLDRNCICYKDIEVTVDYIQDRDGKQMGRFTRTTGLAAGEKVSVTVSRYDAPDNKIYVMALYHNGEDGKYTDEQYDFSELQEAAQFVGTHLTTTWWVPDKKGE